MNFSELDDLTSEYMLARFLAEESGGSPFRSDKLTDKGLVDFPQHMERAIRDLAGNEATLAADLSQPGYWVEREAYVRDGVTRFRRVNFRQFAERLAITEFNTWYVAGFAHRLQAEGETECEVYRAGSPKWAPASCTEHEGRLCSVEEVIAGHRVTYWPPPGVADQLSIPFGPGCHHSIRRVARRARSTQSGRDNQDEVDPR